MNRYIYLPCHRLWLISYSNLLINHVCYEGRPTLHVYSMYVLYKMEIPEIPGDCNFSPNKGGVCTTIQSPPSQGAVMGSTARSPARTSAVSWEYDWDHAAQDVECWQCVSRPVFFLR